MNGVKSSSIKSNELADLPKLANISDSSDNEDEQDYEEDEEESQEYRSLFGDAVFSSVNELFKHEADKFGFDLVDVINRYELTMLDYIKMINFIRAEKPDIGVFKCAYPAKSKMPWNHDKYLKTELENDAVLQFDIEEDLDLLDLKSAKKGDAGSELINSYKKRIAELEAKEEELVEIVGKLRLLANSLLNSKKHSTDSQSESGDDDRDDDSVYKNSYSNYSIHLEMLQDKVRTESYMNAILNNPGLFKDKIVLDVGCGTGILSMFAVKSGAKLVIAVDMSDIIGKAIEIADENDMKDRIKFLKGKIEEVQLPVPKVDIIVSEWMGYFLLFESMLDSVLFARDKYLEPDSGIVLPNLFEMNLFAVSDTKTFENTISFWSNVYGFKMNSMTEIVRYDAQVMEIEPDCVVSNLFKFKEIDCMRVKVEDLVHFETCFELNINSDCEITGIGASFDTHFNHASLQTKVSFSTSPSEKPTHWQQTLFQFGRKYPVQKGSTVKGVIKCMKNQAYSRSYLIELFVFDKIFKYIID